MSLAPGIAMIIRSDQMNVLAKSAEEGFLDAAVRHMQQYSPTLTQAAGEEAVRDAAQAGIAKARSHGFESEGALFFYLDLTVLFGHCFDIDPQYTWMRPYLGPMEGLSEQQRARLLYWHVLAYLERANGPKGEFFDQALQRMPDVTIDRLDRAARARGSHLVEWMHPQRLPFLDGNAIPAIWGKAAECGYGAESGAGLAFLLTMAFGHGAFEDPLHGWLGRAGDETRNKAPASRIEDLLNRTKNYARLFLTQSLEVES
jgi:hypothetical protein